MTNGLPSSNGHSGSFDRVRLVELAEVCMSGEASEEQCRLLEQVLLRDPQAREWYREHIVDSAILRLWATAPQEEVSLDREHAGAYLCDLEQQLSSRPESSLELSPARPLSQTLGGSVSLGRRVWAGIDWKFHPVRFSTVVLLLTAISWIGFYAFTIGLWKDRAGDQFAPQTFVAVATVVDVEKAKYAAGSTAYDRGSLLQLGDVFDLSAGYAEIRFDTGAVLLVEGPTTVRISAENACYLQQGKLRIDIPPKAVGFAVNTEFALLVDLGTSFGVEITSAGLYTSTISGKIEVRRRSARDGSIVGSHILVAGQSAQIDGEQSFRLVQELAPNRFIDKIPRDDERDGLVAHWPFDEREPGDVAENVANRLAANHGAMVGVEGAVGTAYQFDGKSSYVDTKQRTLIPARSDFSIFCWIQTNDDSAEGQYVLNNYRTTQAGRTGLAVRNGKLHFFADGSRIQAYGPFVANGKWHHVGLSRKGDSFYLWVDGATTVVSAPSDISIGQRQSWLIGKRIEDERRSFRGRVDDVRIYHRALTPLEVQQLRRKRFARKDLLKLSSINGATAQ